MTLSDGRVSASTNGKFPTMNLPDVTTISESRPLARTLKQCTVCGQPIAIGLRYSKHVLINHDALNPKKRLVVVRWHLPTCPEGEQ